MYRYCLVGSSFSENFYGLKRSVIQQSDSALRSGKTKGVDAQCAELPQSEHNRSLLFVVSRYICIYIYIYIYIWHLKNSVTKLILFERFSYVYFLKFLVCVCAIETKFVFSGFGSIFEKQM